MATGGNFMDHTGADVGSIVGGAGVIGAVVMFFRWLLALAGARQDGRIAKLERELAHTNNRLMIVAQVAMELSAEVGRIEPGNIVLRRARDTLRAAFPLSGETPSDLAVMAAKLDTKD